jgi:hypothetical protein
MKNIYKGHWWKYGDENNKVFGKLEINGNRQIILTADNLFPAKNGVHAIPEKIGTILGETLDKKSITLLNCESFGFYYNSSIALVGEHFKDFSEIKFKKIIINYSLLNEWAYPDWIKSYTIKNNRTTINYFKKDTISIDISGLNLDISFHFNLNKIRNSKYGKKRKSYMTITSQESKDINEWWNIIKILRNLMVLGLNMPVHPYKFIGITNKKNKVKIPHLDYMNNSNGLEELRRKGNLFTLKDVETDFSIYLNNWFNKSITLNRIATNYYSILNNPDIYNIDKLLNYVSLLEGYHRYNKKNDIIGQSEFINETEKILADSKKCLEKRQLKFLEKHINPFGFEKRLSKRLRELLNENRSLIKLNRKEKTKFIKKVKNTRDYWAHKLIKKESELLKDGELSKAVIALEMLLLACLLREIGFKDELLKKIFERNNKFTYYYNKTVGLFKFE